MKTNRWIASSRFIYARLLYFYPSAHRAEYGDAMLQLFHDQCCAAYNGRGLLGMFTLWLRTFFDLGMSALAEHFSAPGAKWGLLEAMPNKPVPWKGVALVLIPGVIFFVSQIGTLNGELWLYWTLKWAPYVLMAPVLLAWLISRRFPIWGLIPFGLFCNNLVDAATDRITGLMRSYTLDDFNNSPQHFLFLSVRTLYHQLVYEGGVVWLVVAFLIFLGLFLWAQQRRQPLPGAVWGWLMLYLLLSAAQAYLNPQNPLGLGSSMNAMPIVGLTDVITSSITMQIVLQYTRFWTLVSSGIFLLLIFAGRPLARRYGDLAILFPLGYLLGKVVYGLYQTDFGDTILYLVFGVVLLYRTMIALVVPAWVARSSGAARNWALAAPIAVAFIARIVLNQVMAGYFYASPTSLLVRLAVLVDPLVSVAGLALAIAFYRSAMPLEQSKALAPKAVFYWSKAAVFVGLMLIPLFGVALAGQFSPAPKDAIFLSKSRNPDTMNSPSVTLEFPNELSCNPLPNGHCTLEMLVSWVNLAPDGEYYIYMVNSNIAGQPQKYWIASNGVLVSTSAGAMKIVNDNPYGKAGDYFRVFACLTQKKYGLNDAGGAQLTGYPDCALVSSDIPIKR